MDTNVIQFDPNRVDFVDRVQMILESEIEDLAEKSERVRAMMELLQKHGSSRAIDAHRDFARQIDPICWHLDRCYPVGDLPGRIDDISSILSEG